MLYRCVFASFCFVTLIATAMQTGTNGVFADDSFFSAIRPRLVASCGDCHFNGAEEGGLRLEELSDDLGDEAAFVVWQRIYDRVRAGEMPPMDAEPLDKSDRQLISSRLHRALHDSHASSKGTTWRRLNRREYENTLNDLFGTHLDLASMLPEDGRSHEFDNVGSSLNISMVQLQRYLDAADLVIDSAIAKTTEQPKSILKVTNYAETREGETHIGKSWKKLDDGAVVFFRGGGYPSGMLRTANVRESGRYRIRVTGYAYQSEVAITFAIGATTFARGSERPTFAYRSFAPGEPQSTELEAWIESRYMIELTPWGINDAGQVRRGGVDDYAGPGLAFANVELEGPLIDSFPSRGHRLIFDGLNRKEVEPRNPSVKSKSWYVPEFEIETDSEVSDIRGALTRVAAAAFRRPVSDTDIDRYEALYKRQRGDGASIESAIKDAVAAIFCSPDFLFLRESPGWLDDHALATRLAYFLTRTTPDAELLAAAERGTLSTDPGTLLANTKRLLKDPRSDRFVADFTDAWLNLRDIEFTNPDNSLYPEFDAFLQFSMREETRKFFRLTFEENFGVGMLVRPDFAMLNNRLAMHYGIDGVEGPEFRRVALSGQSVRGGLLGQASIHKVSANGTNTSPVVRGIWVLERLLGKSPSPPPPGIPGVEPDIRGVSTLRELLDQHRDVDSCRRCHQMIDPPGFALESFNPIGGWRENYRTLGNGERVRSEVNGRKVNYRIGPDVDASGSFADGRKFDGFRSFRDMLAEDEDRLARTLIQKFLTFGTGREMGFSDRAEIDKIVRESKTRGHRVGDMIELVVQSSVFRRK